MKRIYTLIVLMGLAMGMMLTGCNKEGDQSTSSTNAPANTPTTPSSTNK
jgi:PBP1b-binding outer membrane lipoprotein LpoB